MESIQFSFEGGSALFTWLRKRGFLNQNQPSIRSRILFMVGLTWLPLLVLTTWNGLALSSRVQIPFLFDLIQHARFIVALPLAILAEGYISPKSQSVLSRIVEADLIPKQDFPRFEKAIFHATSLKDSVIAELILLVLAYLYVSHGLYRSVSPGLTTWIQPGETHTSAMLFWYFWVSMPVFTFVWLRWIWRTFIWAFLLFHISRLNLQLTATHPDHAGGLAFISVGQRRFAALVFATSSLVCAAIAEEILFAGAKLRSFESELTAFFFVSVLVVMGPLIVFTPCMLQAKLRDWGKYGVLATRYTREFDDKWIQGKNPSNEVLLGSSDIQSLADLKNSYEGISQMRILLPDRQTIIVLLITYVLPIFPLLMTVIPLRQILTELFKLLTK